MGGDIFGKAASAREKWNIKAATEEESILDVLTVLDEILPQAVTISTEYPEEWDSTKLSGVATASGRKVPIPKGFVVSELEGENTIGGGLVIYQTGNAEIANDFWTELDVNNAELLKCQAQYNQFVWIPIDDINQMVMCKDNNKNDDGTICNLVLQNDDSLKCMTHHASDNGTELCGRLYGVYTSKTFDKRDQIWEITESEGITRYGFREPDDAHNEGNGDGCSIRAVDLQV